MEPICDSCGLEWDELDDLFICSCGYRICSDCAQGLLKDYAYCPKCGAEIDEDLWQHFSEGWRIEDEERAWRLANDK